MKENICLLIIGLLLFALSGCSTGNNAATKKKDMKTVCLDGVTYYLFSERLGNGGYGYMSVKLDKYSKIVPCTD